MLVGRGGAMARLAGALAGDAPTVVTGEAGVGKTALLRAAAAASGRRVFEGGALATLSWLDHLALERAVGRPLRGDTTEVAAEVERIVADGVLVLDDLQCAAVPTVEVVALLADRVAVLAGVRIGEERSAAALHRLRTAGFDVVELSGLDDADARALVRAHRPDLPGTAVAHVLERAGGNPLLLRELAATGEPSASLRLALAARLRRLDAAGREAFGVLTTLGRPVPVDQLGAEQVGSLFDSGLAHLLPDGRVDVRHALLGEVALAELDDDQRRRLHALAAARSEDDGEAARHLAAAGDREAAYAAARRAADHAVAPGERARHLAVAASCAPAPDADALRLAAAAALEEAHDLPTLVEVLAGIDERADPQTRASAALVRARAAWHGGDPAGVRNAIGEGLGLVAGSGSAVEVRLRIEASRIPIFLDGDAAAGLAATTDALALARRQGVDVARAEYLHGTALYVAGDTAAAEVLDQARRHARAAGDVGTEMLAGNNLVACHESAGDPEVGRAVASELVDRARELGLGIWERSFRMASSNLDFHAGRYDDVVATAEELLALPLEARTREALLEQLCLALVDLGRGAEAERRIAAVPDRGDDWTLRRQKLWVLTEAALWGGKPRRALALADEIIAGPPADANIAFARVSRAWARFELGLPPDTEAGDDQQAMLAAVPPELDGVRLLHAGDPCAAVAAFDRAAAAWQGYHRRGEVRCRWAAGEAARRGGAPAAIDRLLVAERDAERHGMRPIIGRVHRSLRAAGVRRSAPRHRAPAGLLSARELQVLELVGQGLDNAEIAARLGLSRHTVVAQIASASAKLNAGSRAQAAGMAALLPQA